MLYVVILVLLNSTAAICCWLLSWMPVLCVDVQANDGCSRGFWKYTCGEPLLTLQPEVLSVQRFAGWLAQICDENSSMHGIFNSKFPPKECACGVGKPTCKPKPPPILNTTDQAIRKLHVQGFTEPLQGDSSSQL